MATRLWGSLLGRRGSSAEDGLPDATDQQQTGEPRRSSSSHVQTLGSMRSKSSSISTTSMSSPSANGTSSTNNTPDQLRVASPAGGSGQLADPQGGGASFITIGSSSSSTSTSPFSAAAGGSANKVLTDAPAPTATADNDQPAHDSASSSYDAASDCPGHLSRRSSGKAPGTGMPAAPQQEPSAPANGATGAGAAFAATPDAERTLSLSLGFSPDHMAPARGSSSSAQQHGGSVMSFASHSSSQGPSSSSAQLQYTAGSTAAASPGGSTPRLSSPTVFLGQHQQGMFSAALTSPELAGHSGAGLLGMQGSGAGHSQGGVAGSLEALIAELQATAGLSAEQAAAAAAVMMPRMSAPAASAAAPNPFHAPPTTCHNPWAHSPPGHGFGMLPPPLSPTHGAMSPLSPLHPSSNPDLGVAAFLNAGAQAELLGSPAAAAAALGAAAGAFGGPLMGLDSVHSSCSNNVVSGSGFAGLMGGAPGGMISPQDSYLAEAAQYAHDGLDVPGTAQVAVHNVPFKWCNEDLEDLFKQQEGYLDAQLLFHENGRSKGVGVGLFRDRSCAVEACNKLSGAQADGRKLELVLMNPDNHVSFSCRQVAVLGLPWEYTSADVRALLEAAAEADDAAADDAGVQNVEVAYRDDGKSEGRAIATFASRRQAHDAIRRLHGKETLAGLRMRLFYLHEQQQTRNQNVLAQLRTQQQFLPSLMPHLAGLSLGDTSGLSPRHPHSLSATPGAASNTSRQNLFSNGAGAGAGAGGGGGIGSVSGDGGGSGEVSGSGNAEGVKEGDGSGGEAGAGGAQGQAEAPRSTTGDDQAPGSGRSSLEKDQGPVILHVSGLMESVTREQLRELFSQAGEVTKVDIPDGGRSMGYGFITFSNPQAAEQAMLLFNNYPLGGGAIHVAYSTSATAKARQQALRQARKATLGNSRASIDGGSGRQPGTPRGMAGVNGRRGGPGINLPFPSNPSFGALGAGGMGGGLDGMGGPPRNSFDVAGYGSSLGSLWPRGPGAGMPPGGMGGLVGFSSSLGAMAGTPPGMHAAAAMGRGRRNSFEYGMAGPMGAMGGPSALQMLQGAGGRAGYPVGVGGAGLDVSTAGNLDQQLQLLMHMTGTAGEPGPFGPGAGGLLGMPGGQPGTPPPAGGLRTNPLGAGTTGGLFSPPMSAGAVGGGLGGFGGAAGAFAGLTTPPGPYSAQGGLFGGNPASAAAVQGSMLAPPSLLGGGGAAGLGMAGSGAGGLGMEGQQQGGVQRQVLVTGLPPGLTDGDLRALFEICGPLRIVNKQPEQDFAIITYDTIEHARKAINVLDGTKLPSGTTLSLQFTSLMPNMVPGPDTPARTADMPWNPAISPAGAPTGMFGAGTPSAFATGLATPPRGSFAGDAGVGGGLGSGSLFPVGWRAEAGSTGELFGGAFGGGSSHLGGFGSVGSGLRAGASSPAYGSMRGAGAGVSGGPATAAASSLYSPAPIRAGSPGLAGQQQGQGGRKSPGLPPMYAATGLGLTGSGSAGNLFGRGVGAHGSEGGSAPGSDVVA